MGVRKILARMRQGGDGEHQIVLNRLVIACIVQIYLLGIYLYGAITLGRLCGLSAICGTFLLGAIAIAVALLLWPRPSQARRILQLGWDLGFLSLGMHQGRIDGIPLYPIYLWVILGYGFRFGLTYIAAAAVLGASGFVLAVHDLPVWRDTGYLFAGLVIGLLIIPLYSASLIRFLSDTRRRAEEASRAKTLFLASVSHELRTPLNAVIGMGRLLGESALDTEQRDMVRTIRAAGTSLLGMIEDLLDFSRIEDGRMPVRARPFALLSVLNEVRRIVGVAAHDKRLQICIHVTARTPSWLVGDDRHVRDILLNLAGNAVKFTERGHVVIAVDGAALPGGGVGLRFEVSDSGIGIPEAAQQRVFETFTQADDSVIDRFGGTGLGLAICRRLVDLMGGEMGLRSLEGQGSTFWFTIRLQEAAPASVPPASASPPSASPASASPTSAPAAWPGLVLLTRNAARYADLLARIGRLGAHVTVVPSPDAAAALLGRSETRAILLADGAETDAGTDAGTGDAGTAAARPPAILLGPAAADGLPDEATRRNFLSILPPDADDGAITTVLGLAAALMPERPDPSEPATPLSEGLVAARSLSILVVEDNIVNQKVLCKTLSRVGHRWRAAANGEEALERLEAESFDLVLMDLNMPVMNGIEATKLYRFSEVGAGASLPIVALTADGTQETQARCREAGMNGFLLKPIEIEALLQTIDALVPASAGQRPARPEPLAPPPPLVERAVVVPFPAVTLNRKMVQDLQALGGTQFRADLIGDFLTDAAAIIDRMADALAAGKWTVLLDEAHSLRSAAANVGAERLTSLCQEWRGFDFNRGAGAAHAHLLAIRQEMDKVHEALFPYTILSPQDGIAP
ncbi:ATP-binding protein [Nguyenibacter vanlangensis]|uniref:histidine kinase n=1 Tax=Nguyenibacter vanlangensis TaxID=1216886 RepID=A0ABZ3D3X5_9PROT